MKTIVIPTDFSNNAWRAAGYAANIYRNTPCRFVIFHAYYEPGGALEPDIPHIIATRSKEINENLEKIKAEFGEFEHHPDTIIETVARYGEPHTAIMTEVKNEFADVIVMGKAGASDSSTLGSLTMELLEFLPCPIICIPENSEVAPPKHIMFAADYHNLKNLDQMNVLKEIAETNKSRISIVNIKEDLQIPVPIADGMEGLVLHNFFGDIPHEYFDHEEKNVEEGILDFAHQKDVNLVVMLNRSRKYWEDLFHKSMSMAVGINSDIPLLVLKD